MAKSRRMVALRGAMILTLMALGGVQGKALEVDTRSGLDDGSGKSDQLGSHADLVARAATVPFHISQGVSMFTKSLGAALASDPNNNGKNMVFSPFSIHTAMSFAFYGSDENSATNKELSAALGMTPRLQNDYIFNYLRVLDHYKTAGSGPTPQGQPSKPSEEANPKAQIKVANKMYLREGFTIKPDFQTILTRFYLTSAENLDFKDMVVTADAVNSYVKNETEGLIKEIVSPSSFDDTTVAILINAIYFKAEWKLKFDKSRTKPMVFQGLGGDNKRLLHIRGMNQNGPFKSLRRVPELNGADVLELPYEDEDFAMYILMPAVNDLSALNRLLGELDMDVVTKRISEGENSGQKQQHQPFLRVQVPAFETTFNTGLKSALIKTGIEAVFKDADLNSIADGPLFLSEAVHSARIEVNEEGSEAAAATVVVVGIRSGSPDDGSRSFIVDRPFVFVIYDKVHKLPLFVGRVVDPTVGQKNRRQQQPFPNPALALAKGQEEKAD